MVLPTQKCGASHPYSLCHCERCTAISMRLNTRRRSFDKLRTNGPVGPALRRAQDQRGDCHVAGAPRDDRGCFDRLRTNGGGGRGVDHPHPNPLPSRERVPSTGSGRTGAVGPALRRAQDQRGDCHVAVLLAMTGGPSTGSGRTGAVGAARLPRRCAPRYDRGVRGFRRSRE